MDKKRQRDEALAETLLEQAKKGLPLSRDALLHMTTFLDWQALRNFCNVNDEMRQFCHVNQVWKRKFVRQVSLLPPQSQLLLHMTPDQWIKYWDFLAGSQCPSLDILFAAFVTLFDYYKGGPNALRLTKNIIRFSLDIKIDEDEAHFIPVVYGCSVRLFDIGSQDFRWIRSDHNNEVGKMVAALGWKIVWVPHYFHGKRIAIEMTPTHAVTIIYKFFEFGYLPTHFNFKRVTSCATCASPAPLTVCGACEAIPYCNQECADAHWKKHKCTE